MGLVSTARAAVTWDGTVQIALCRCPAQAAAVGTERVRLVIALAIPTGQATIAATCLTVQDSCLNLASTAPGMVFALETYAGNEDGSDGVRLEDEVVVTDTGIEVITKFPTDRIIGCGMNY